MKQEIINVAFYVTAIFTLIGCSSTEIVETETAPIAISQSNETVVILGRRHLSHNATEVDYVSCLGDNLSTETAPLNIIPEQQFIDAMYPYFETSTAPLSVNKLGQMLQAPAFAKKLDDINLRYLIWIDGHTETLDQSGGISCAIGPGGGGCLGFAVWDDEANYEANIWDLDTLSLTAQVNTKSSGTSYLPAIVIPIPLLADVQESACDDMARSLRRLISS